MRYVYADNRRGLGEMTIRAKNPVAVTFVKFILAQAIIHIRGKYTPIHESPSTPIKYFLSMPPKALVRQKFHILFCCFPGGFGRGGSYRHSRQIFVRRR